jgi:hypothetical protein
MISLQLTMQDGIHFFVSSVQLHNCAEMVSNQVKWQVSGCKKDYDEDGIK